MELRDMILSTLSEIEGEDTKKEKPLNKNDINGSSEDEKKFLQDLRERILVLFEGFKAPNNKEIEAKVDLTLNFLEYVLARLDERLEKIS